MKTKSNFLILLLLSSVFLMGCNGQSQGYGDLDLLYADFVKYLKSSDENLKQYCHKITPGAGTVAWMEKNNFSYRGIPEELKKQNVEVKVIGDKYYEMVSGFKQRLTESRQLESLTYVGREEPGEELFNKELNIYATETFIILKSGNDTIRCKLGEMFKVDGKWKSFTSPKLGW